MKMISHSTRLMKKSNRYVGDFNPVYEVMSDETFAENGRVLKRTAIKTLDMSEVMAQYSPDDFRIENLVAVGALQDGKRYTYNPTTMEVAENVENAFNILNDIVDNNNVNNVQE